MYERIIFSKIISELDKLESFSPKYKYELRLLSKKIRKDFWSNNDVNLLFFYNSYFIFIAEIFSLWFFYSKNTLSSSS